MTLTIRSSIRRCWLAKPELSDVEQADVEQADVEQADVEQANEEVASSWLAGDIFRGPSGLGCVVRAPVERRALQGKDPHGAGKRAGAQSQLRDAPVSITPCPRFHHQGFDHRRRSRHRARTGGLCDHLAGPSALVCPSWRTSGVRLGRPRRDQRQPDTYRRQREFGPLELLRPHPNPAEGFLPRDTHARRTCEFQVRRYQDGLLPSQYRRGFVAPG